MTIEQAIAEIKEAAQLLWSEHYNGSSMCLNDAAACLEQEIATLRAAITTPEVYADVITRVLEDERDRLIQEIRDFREQLSKAPEAIGEVQEPYHEKDQT